MMSKKIKTRIYNINGDNRGYVKDKETWNALKAGAISCQKAKITDKKAHRTRMLAADGL